MSAITPSGSGGANSTTTVVGATNPLVVNVAMPTAATEYSWTVPDGAKQFLIKGRILDEIQFSYMAGQSGTLYITIPRGCHYEESDVSTTSKTLYLQSAQGGQVLEVLVWT